jgi:hypothetical protein
MSPDKPQNPLSLESLEARLRSLPGPKVPEGLEARLIAQVPVRLGRAIDGYRPRHWWPTGAAIAAGLVLALLAGLYLRGTPARQPEIGPATASIEEIENHIAREAVSARLLATARILERYPEGRAEARRNYECIANVYSDTEAAKEIRRAETPS